MFTQTLKPRLRDRVLRSSLVDLLTGPHGVDRYTELVEPTWTVGDARAKVVAVRRDTPRSVTLTLEPNAVFTAAQEHVGQRRKAPAGRPARQPHRRDRRPEADPLLLARQR